MEHLGMSKTLRWSLALTGMMAWAGLACADVVLIDENFDQAEAGVALEQAVGSQWSPVAGKLAIGGGRALNDQALGYVKGNTWKMQVYERPVSATLAGDESFQASFSAAVRRTASPQFYIYALRLHAGDDFVELGFKGDAERPTLTATVSRQGKPLNASSQIDYYAKAPDAGLAAVRIISRPGKTFLTHRLSKSGPWTPVGEPLADGLGAIDKVSLRYYAVGFWSAMDDIQVMIAGDSSGKDDRDGQ